MVTRSSRLWIFVSLLVLSPICSKGQTAPTTTQPPIDEKSMQIVKRGLETVGGDAYLKVNTVLGKGFFTAYQEGVSQVPARFIDYISYPDKERTEFFSGGIRIVQTNTGNTGWVYDGATKTLNDMKSGQIADFRQSMRSSLENLLRGWWRNDGGVVKYMGRREAGLATRNETVRLTYPDGFWVEYEFNARDGKPAKIIYQRTHKKADSDEEETVTEEDHLAKPIVIDGVTAPWIVDHFINGTQASRINYESIQYNIPIAESVFAKPENAKSLK